MIACVRFYKNLEWSYYEILPIVYVALSGILYKMTASATKNYQEKGTQKCVSLIGWVHCTLLLIGLNSLHMTLNLVDKQPIRDCFTKVLNLTTLLPKRTD